MEKDKKIWALLPHLSMHFGYNHYDKMPFEDDFWDYVVENAAKAGYNTIVLDIGDGIELGSHPEIAMKGAWSRQRVHDEVKRCRALGMELIPKFNFSAGHSQWLGKYSRMISTDVYYKVCRDIILEAYELFEHPSFIHIGMDEEDEEHARYNKEGYAMFRRGELYWHDLRFLLDCVHETGARPWMWYDATLGLDPKVVDSKPYKEHVGIAEAILSPWYYCGLVEEEFTKVEDYPWDLSAFAGMGLRYMEEMPKLVDFRKNIVSYMDEGFEYIPCSWAKSKHNNTYELMELFKKGPDDKMLGHIVSTWCSTEWKNKEIYDNAFEKFKKAKETFYK